MPIPPSGPVFNQERDHHLNILMRLGKKLFHAKQKAHEARKVWVRLANRVAKINDQIYHRRRLMNDPTYRQKIKLWSHESYIRKKEKNDPLWRVAKREAQKKWLKRTMADPEKASALRDKRNAAARRRYHLNPASVLERKHKYRKRTKRVVTDAEMLRRSKEKERRKIESELRKREIAAEAARVAEMNESAKELSEMRRRFAKVENTET